MKSPPRKRSARAAGAPPEHKTVRNPMKRRAVGRPPRATALALGGLPLRLICLGGVPAWAPSVLLGVCIRGGRGRWVEPQRRGEDRQDGRAGNPQARGGQGGRRPPGGGLGGDAGRSVGGAPPAPGSPGGDAPPAPGSPDVDNDYLLDVSRWIGIIDDKTMNLMGMEDTSIIYQPYFASVGKNQKDGYVVSLNKLLAGVYSEMLDTYIDIYLASFKKMESEKKCGSLPGDIIKEMVQEVNCALKVSFIRYHGSENYVTNLMEKIEKLDAEPLQKPLILEKDPSRFDFKKEKRAELKKLKKEEKKMKKEETKLSNSSGKKKASNSSGKKKASNSSGKKAGNSSGKKKASNSSGKKKGDSSSGKRKEGHAKGDDDNSSSKKEENKKTRY